MLLELFDAVLADVEVEALFDELTDVDHLIFLVVIEASFKLCKFTCQLISHLDHA